MQKLQILGALTVAGIVAGAGSAFTAGGVTNAVNSPTPLGGKVTVTTTATNWAVTGVTYTLDHATTTPGDPSRITAVNLTTTGAPNSTPAWVRIDGTHLYNCRGGIQANAVSCTGSGADTTANSVEVGLG